MSVSALTKTFKHAIELTTGLGFTHIWIDSLCIIQGDQEDWNHECRRMYDVYGGAELVIAAACAKNGNDGLFSDREPGKRIEFETSTGNTTKATVSAHRGNIDKHDIWKTGEQYWVADGLPLFTRAWAFQERMLAKRIVHFTDYEVIWECRSHATCECGDLIDERTSWSDFGPGKTIKTKYQHVIDWGCDLDRLNFWNDIAAQYSARNITKSSDRLPALDSIARQIDCCGMLGRYLCGIWEESLPHSLLWWSEFKDLERFPSPDQQTTTHFRPAIRSIPSWSWLSIEGRVSTWGRAVNVIARVTNISFKLAGDDPYGECKEAAITLQGPTTPMRVGSSSQPGNTTAPVVFEPASCKEYQFDADTHPFEYADSDLSNIPTMALGFSISGFRDLGGGELCCIILRQVSGKSDRYQRIGLAYLPSRLFASAKVRDVIVV
ncbi:heterokaryon incompatibility [Fusarium agapanthi]|uniref:Heterokaryon incompatibility n=1 Tax=Fusarium agapanthi TaxID=1803897 RepID=A0A9P5BAK2_9HYPO|nr:heterokaryon incompatibility [Fusarium agapanthi]